MRVAASSRQHRGGNQRAKMVETETVAILAPELESPTARSEYAKSADLRPQPPGSLCSMSSSSRLSCLLDEDHENNDDTNSSNDNNDDRISVVTRSKDSKVYNNSSSTTMEVEESAVSVINRNSNSRASSYPTQADNRQLRNRTIVLSALNEDNTETSNERVSAKTKLEDLEFSQGIQTRNSKRRAVERYSQQIIQRVSNHA